MKNIEQELIQMNLPCHEDIQHRYQLRRAILSCPYFERSYLGLILNSWNFSFFQRRWLFSTVFLGFGLSFFMVPMFFQRFIPGELKKSAESPVVVRSIQPVDLTPRLASNFQTRNQTPANLVDLNVGANTSRIRYMTLFELEQLLREQRTRSKSNVIMQNGNNIYVYSEEPSSHFPVKLINQ